ncbi:MAG: allantoate amidohydrolase, partial [Actinobacteria bacterium]|nr:allantoate amidohydrolase [Actinomycetota bacterium]
MWDELAPVGRSAATGGYRRFAWTRTDHDLREWFAGQAADRGLSLVLDRAGNQWAWWGEPSAARPGVVIGSHLDSVPDGGAFDGPLGVVSAFAAVDALRAQGFTPDRPVGVVNFVDEEGARFGIACAGSRLITGALEADRARALTDADATSMAEAMRAAGVDPAGVGADRETLDRIGCFVELHVEQGRGLIDLGAPVAVAASILGHGRWRLRFTGQGNHAGTTLMSGRRDPMVAAAATIAQIPQLALARAPAGARATVGRLEVTPGGTNVIASHVDVWLD